MAKVPFRGGSITDIVRCPARYATSKLVEQVFIENSQEFQAGKIVLMDSLEIPDDAEEKARKAALAKNATAPIAESTTPVTEPAPTSEPTNVPSGNAEGTEVDTAETQDSGDGVQTIEVGCKADAVEWLKERFPTKGYNGNNLRANAVFEAACNEAGVRFIIKNA